MRFFMKKYLIPTIVATSLLVPTASMAKVSVLSQNNDGPTIYTFNIITPNNQTIILDEIQEFAGSSTSNPCSDLHAVYTIYNSSQEPLAIDPGSYPQTSAGTIDAFGKAQTCLKVDMYYHGKDYSTGNILLKWDTTSGEYLSANPKSCTFNFNN